MVAASDALELRSAMCEASEFSSLGDTGELGTGTSLSLDQIDFSFSCNF